MVNCARFFLLYSAKISLIPSCYHSWELSFTLKSPSITWYNFIYYYNNHNWKINIHGFLYDNCISHIDHLTSNIEFNYSSAIILQYLTKAWRNTLGCTSFLNWLVYHLNLSFGWINSYTYLSLKLLLLCCVQFFIILIIIFALPILFIGTDFLVEQFVSSTVSAPFFS